jgi:hypothetical protein
MLPLQSSRWAQLESSVGGDGTLAAELLTSAKAGDISALAELQHQACHQFSVGEVAYAIVPHLVELASAFESESEARVQALTIIGCVAAGAAAFASEASSPPSDLHEEYYEALRSALPLALAALESETLSPGQVTNLLGVVAVLKRRVNLALHLLLHGGSDGELSCPECGEYIAWTAAT